MTRSRRIEIREVLVHLGGSEGLLEGLRREGLFESDFLDPREAEELRIAALMIEELGVNPAGVQVALHLRRRLLALESRVTALADHLRRTDLGRDEEG
ncbi:MAG: hypothetical protein U0900_21200 [Myxococcota bacterium]